MLLGIDVGGTHTDAVVVHDNAVAAWVKIPTKHDDLLASVHTALEAVLKEVDAAGITKLNLSTTLSTNAVVEGKTEEVGVFVTAGPGIDPETMRIGRHFYLVDGALDHRGTVIKPLDKEKARAAAEKCKAAGISVFACVGKFSTRNPDHEDEIAEVLKEVFGEPEHITAGHSVSGELNFPRRTATACFNAAVWRTHKGFAEAVKEAVADFGLDCEINILKADGGTVPVAVSMKKPVETILSGPAASVMGTIALSDVAEDCLILDIGGTTTDIAVFSGGAPIIEKDGMVVGSYPTLVKSLKIHSIGIGGDSTVRVTGRGVTVGPDRQGPSLADCEKRQGNKAPTRRKCAPALTDVLNVLGISDYGDVEASKGGIEKLARLWDMSAEVLCKDALDYALKAIARAVDDMLHDINHKPVYTIVELLEGKSVNPAVVYVMGGPSEALAPFLAKALDKPVRLPRHASVANAVGAAVTRTTFEIELFADTQRRKLVIPGLRINKDIPSSYRLEDAEKDALEALRRHLSFIGADPDDYVPEVVEAGSFNMVDGVQTMGRNIRVRCRVRPGVAVTVG
jgi:N-methylhydantoinase A/oxoprolinase/acetone carboxylase beta subunit